MLLQRPFHTHEEKENQSKYLMDNFLLNFNLNIFSNSKENQGSQSEME